MGPRAGHKMLSLQSITARGEPQVSNNSTASFGMLSSDTTVAAGAAGADPKALAFGVRHSF
jgi:hypothetical protein